jgi:hypothetical protein
MDGNPNPALWSFGEERGVCLEHLLTWHVAREIYDWTMNEFCHLALCLIKLLTFRVLRVLISGIYCHIINWQFRIELYPPSAIMACSGTALLCIELRVVFIGLCSQGNKDTVYYVLMRSVMGTEHICCGIGVK